MSLSKYLDSCLAKTPCFGSFDCWQFIKGFYPQLPDYKYTNLGEIKRLCVKHNVKSPMEKFRQDFKEHGFKITKNPKEGDIAIFPNYSNEEILGFVLKSGKVIGLGEKRGLTITNPETKEVWSNG